MQNSKSDMYASDADPSPPQHTTSPTVEYHLRPPKPHHHKQGPLIDTLLQRSVTGQRIDIEIHRHRCDKLHLVWRDNNVNKDKCLERWFFNDGPMYKLRKHSTLSPIEGTCTCVIAQEHNPPSSFCAVPCTRPIIIPANRSVRYKGRSARTYGLVCLCTCPVTYSDTVHYLD